LSQQSHIIKKTIKHQFDFIVVILFLLFFTFIIAFTMANSQQLWSNDFLVNTLTNVLGSPLFLSFSILYIGISLIVRYQLTKQMDDDLQTLQQLENWANLSKIRGQQQSLTIKGVIPAAITELQQQLHQANNNESQFDSMLRASALLDNETGIGNRAFFNNRLEALLKDEDVQGAVYFMQFKGCDLVQSLYGHQQAMSLLESLIHSIKYRLQHLSNYFLARRGEFELALIIPGIFLCDAEKLADRLIKNILSVRFPVGINKDEFVHIGISYFSYAEKAYQIKAEADMALRSAQLQGPAQWFMYDVGEIEQNNAKGSLRWRTFLTKAIQQNAFVLFFQPVISSCSEKVLHHEVLSKVRDSDGSLVSARVFLPMAQKCGLSQTIDLLIFEQVCRLLTYDSAQNDDCSLNLSIESLLSETFIEHFIAKIAYYKEVAPRIIIEISEYHLVNNLEELKPVLVRLHQHGVKLLADKVGQYVVSSKYLQSCPISALKLHRSIVLNVHQKSENQIFIQSLTRVCQPRGVNIFALGVEHIDEWRMLVRLGIQGGQGHYFTEPVAQVARAIHLP